MAKSERRRTREARRLKSIRDARGWTQVEMADRLGLTVRSYQDLEWGRRTLSRPCRLLVAVVEAGFDPLVMVKD